MSVEYCVREREDKSKFQAEKKAIPLKVVCRIGKEKRRRCSLVYSNSVKGNFHSELEKSGIRRI